MCIATASLAIGALGAATSAIGSIQAGQAASANASYQSQVAANNAIIAKQNANYATAAGEEKASQESMANAGRIGAIRASEAANNVDVNTGSAANVQKSQRETGSLDSLTTMNNALLQAYGYKSQATGFQAESGLDSQEAGQDEAGGFLSAGGGLLGNASSLGFKYQSSGGGSGGFVANNTAMAYPQAEF